MGTILIVDKDPVFGAVLEDHLRAAGHQVELLARSDRAVARAAASQPDLVVLEIGQPFRQGLEGLEALRHDGATRDLPVLVLSENVESADRVAALRAGAGDYLTKPCDLEELLLRAERLIETQATASPVLQGDLADHPLWELMQYIQQTGKNGELVIRAETGTAKVRFASGQIVAASFKELPFAEALLAIFSIKQGRFRFHTGTVEGGAEASEAMLVHELLMQAAWLEDELRKRRELLPISGAPLECTDRDLPPLAEDFEFAALPLREIRQRVAERPGIRLYDLIQGLPAAPQKIRLGVAWMVQHGFLTPPSEKQTYPTTHEISSAVLVDVVVSEFLNQARDAGFGTSALPFLILVEPDALPRLVEVVGDVPGFKRNEALVEFAAKLDQGRGASVAFPTEGGKLWLHVHLLQSEMTAQVEAVVTVCAGVLVWLADGKGDLAAVVERLERVKGAVRGLVVTPGKAARQAAEKAVAKARRWRLIDHEPRSLLGVFRLVQPSPDD